MPKTALERYEAKVDKSAGPDGCWPWIAAVTGGYGSFMLDGKVTTANRAGYRLLVSDFPDLDDQGRRILVCHACDNPICQNPAHWFLGTDADNNQDKETKGRGNHPCGDRNGARTRPDRRARGSRHWAAKLDAEAVTKIRQAYAAGGVTYRELAARFKVSPAVVRGVVVGTGWKVLT